MVPINQAPAVEPPGNRIKTIFRQSIKWLVYSLLLVNFLFYFLEELEFASHTMRTGGTLLEWTTAFATTADELAWFGLLFLFELETYVLSDEALKPWLKRSFHLLRLICYLFLAHTIYAWGDEVVKLETLQPDSRINELCQLAGQEISFTRNLEYTVIDQSNCEQLAEGPVFYPVEDTVFTDQSGFITSRQLAWVDLIEALSWLLVLLTIEMAVRLQERGITGGRLMMVSYSGKALYGLIFGAAVYWAYKGHWFYTWDELLWIGGFFAIELNMKMWRDEIAEQAEITKAVKSDVPV